MRRSSSRSASAELPPGSNLPEPDEPRHAGVGCLFEQMLEVAPKPARTRSAMRALRVDRRIAAEPLDRRRGRQDGWRAAAGLDEPAHQILLRLRLFRFFSDPPEELTRRAAAREGPESVRVRLFCIESYLAHS